MTRHRAAAIWDRACSPEARDLRFPGDRALADMLLLHGLIMNGGVAHGFDALDDDEIDAALRGFDYFGLGNVADLLRRLREELRSAPPLDDTFATTARYLALVDDDQRLIDAFDATLSERPDDFEPC